LIYRENINGHPGTGARFSTGLCSNHIYIKSVPIKLRLNNIMGNRNSQYDE